MWALNGVFETQIHPNSYSIIIYAGINMLLAIALNLVNGVTGQFSLGVAGFMAVGAYFSAFLSLTAMKQLGTVPDLLFLGILISGGLMAGLFGLIVGLPSLRLQGDYLAIVTLGFGEIVRVILLNLDTLGGARGLPGIPHLSNFGWVFGILAVSYIFLTSLIKSPFGRGLLSVREDEIAAEASGIDTTAYKVKSFVISSFFAGLGGGLFAHHLSYINPQTFDFNRSFEIIIMVVLGGMGSMRGALVAALVLTFMKEALRPLQEWTGQDYRMVIYSVLLIAMMLSKNAGKKQGLQRA